MNLRCWPWAEPAGQHHAVWTMMAIWAGPGQLPAIYKLDLSGSCICRHYRVLCVDLYRSSRCSLGRRRSLCNVYAMTCSTFVVHHAFRLSCFTLCPAPFHLCDDHNLRCTRAHAQHAWYARMPSTPRSWSACGRCCTASAAKLSAVTGTCSGC